MGEYIEFSVADAEELGAFRETANNYDELFLETSEEA